MERENGRQVEEDEVAEVVRVIAYVLEDRRKDGSNDGLVDMGEEGTVFGEA